MGKPWFFSKLDTTMLWGLHPSARTPLAAETIYAKTHEKVQDRYACILPWAQLCQQHPTSLKISLVAAVTHKSHSYRMILDLSFAKPLSKTNSLNATTHTSKTPIHLIQNLGWILACLIHALALAPTGLPILFCKLKIIGWGLAPACIQ